MRAGGGGGGEKKTHHYTPPTPPGCPCYEPLEVNTLSMLGDRLQGARSLYTREYGSKKGRGHILYYYIVGDCCPLFFLFPSTTSDRLFVFEQGGRSLYARATSVGHGTTTELISENSRCLCDFLHGFAFHI